MTSIDKQHLISNDGEQRIALKISTNDGRASAASSAFAEGEHLTVDELEELGLDNDVSHMKIIFDVTQSAKYMCCKDVLKWLFISYMLPLFIFCLPCIKYGATFRAKSRVAAVTESKLVMRSKNYSCCCTCLNEKTKSIPLNQITDLRLEQGCVQRCFDIHSVVVDTASSAGGLGEMHLIGLLQPRVVRRLVLKVRDEQTGQNPADGEASKAAAITQEDTAALELLVEQQHQTMKDIRDVLQDMKAALVSMDQKMPDTEEKLIEDDTVKEE